MNFVFFVGNLKCSEDSSNASSTSDVLLDRQLLRKRPMFFRKVNCLKNQVQGASQLMAYFDWYKILNKINRGQKMYFWHNSTISTSLISILSPTNEGYVCNRV